jgi:hypothetical protein
MKPRKPSFLFAPSTVERRRILCIKVIDKGKLDPPAEALSMDNFFQKKEPFSFTKNLMVFTHLMTMDTHTNENHIFSIILGGWDSGVCDRLYTSRVCHT